MQYVEVIFCVEGETDYNYAYISDDTDPEPVIDSLVPDGYELLESKVLDCPGDNPSLLR